MSYVDLINNLGFSSDPFAQINADEEEKLEEYFIQPPFFTAVYGDPLNPRSYIVFAPRGAGKTALKRKIELSSVNNTSFLCVTYNYFNIKDIDLGSLTIDYHLENIIRLILLNSVPLLNKDKIKEMEKGDRELLFLFIQKYFNNIDSTELLNSINSIKSLNQKSKQWWNNIVTPVGQVASLITSFFGVPSIQLTHLIEKEIDLGSTYQQLETLHRILLGVGFNSIYVLIDKIDETELTSTSENSFKFIEPVLKNLQVLELKGYSFKLFLWDGILQYINQNESIRFDRINNRELKWSHKQLKEMLTKRLLAFNDNNINSLNQIMPESEIDWDDFIVRFGNRSPRKIINLCKEILEQQSELDSDANKITLAAINLGINNFSNNYCKYLFKDAIKNDILKIKKTDFTTNHIANNVLKTTHNTAIAKIKTWQDNDVIKKIGEIRVGNSKKPSMHYAYTDCLIAKFAFQELNSKDFYINKVRICQSCQETLIRDWDISDQHNCHECQTPFIKS